MERPYGIGLLAVGDVGLITKVTVFKKIKLGTHENVGSGRVHLPEMEMHTTSFWWELPETLLTEMSELGHDLGDALKGLSHLLGRVAPIFIMADPSDLHSTAMVRSPFTGRPTLYLYDAFPGGVGFAGRIFEQFDEICTSARDHLGRCPCVKGCPSCVGATADSGDTARVGATWLLDRALDRSPLPLPDRRGQAAGEA
jgi:DEAD/DEAH box helicase domain-containing protein